MSLDTFIVISAVETDGRVGLINRECRVLNLVKHMDDMSKQTVIIYSIDFASVTQQKTDVLNGKVLLLYTGQGIRMLIPTLNFVAQHDFHL